MEKRKFVETFDLSLQDIMDTNMLFSGKVVVFGGDFRQTLPVVQNVKKKRFYLLKYVEFKHLKLS